MRKVVASDGWVAMQVDWEGVLAVPVADRAAGTTMRACFAMFFEFRKARSCVGATMIASSHGRVNSSMVIFK